MRNRINRRDFVIQAAAVAGGAVIGCTSADDPGPISEIPSLDHIIVVTMENRSFDHLLGWLPGADGRQNLGFVDNDGVSRSTHHLTITESCAFASPNHSFEGGRQEYNNGMCDGWLRADGNDLYTIGYYLGTDLPFLGEAATEWLVLDRYFCPIMGPTYPNRIISLAAQTDRLVNTVDVSTLPTIWDRLIPAGLTGKNYGSTPRTSSILWGARYASLIRPITEFYSDAAAGTLPNVSFVDPDLSSDLNNSYHPPGDIRNAEAFLASIYKAVTTSPQWKKSLLVITFDEWGGFFDHVPPPVAPIPPGEQSIGNTDGLRGFRIPTVLVSPFVKRKSISSRVYDHASVLRMIESRWNLQPLTIRDAQANNLMDEIDLSLPVTAAPVIDYSAGPFVVAC